MAKVASSSTTNSNNSTVSELTVGISGSSSGDLLVVYFESSDSNSVFQQKSGTTGWTKRMNTPYVFGDRSFAVFTKTAGASETAPTFEEASARSGYMTAVYTVVENADTTSPVIAYAEDRSDVGNHFNLPTVDTTGDDDALILTFCGADSYSRALSFIPTVNHYASNTQNSHAVIAGWFYQQTGGTTPALEVLKSQTSTNQVGKLVVAIKDDGTKAITGQVIPTTEPAELIQGCLYNQITSSNVTSLITDLDGDTPTSKNLSSEESNPFTNLDSYPWTYKYISNTSNPNLAGGSFYSSTLDLSSSLISFSMAPKSYDAVKSWDSGGRYFGLISGSDSAAKVWKVEAKDTELRVKGGVFPYIIDTSMSSYDSFGTFDVTDVTKFCFGINRDGTTENTIGYIYKLGIMVLGYGNSTTPCSFSDAARHSKTASLRTVQSQGGQSSSQFYISQDVDIGNYGTNATYWKSSNQSMEMPAAYDVGSRFVHHQIDTSRLFLTIKAGASDTIDLSSCTLNFGDFHNFVVGASCSSSATYNFNGLVVLNSLVELNPISGYDYVGVTFSGCKELTTNGADLSGGCTISNCVDAQAITVTSEAEFAKLANCTFKSNAVAIKITGDQSGTWSDISLTVSGNTYDIEYTGTTNFTIQSAATLTVNNSSSGVLTVSTPTTDVTVNSNIASSDIKIFDGATSQTILASATGTTAAYTYSGTKTFYYTVQKVGYVPQRGSISGTNESLTVNVTLKVDPVYTSSHGLTYTTDYAYNATTRVLTLVAAEEGRNVYSSLVEQFISNSSFDNREFPLNAIGPDRIDFTSDGTTAATIDSGDIAFWRGAGMEWEHATTGAKTHKFCSVKGVGANAAGTKGYYQYAAGSGTTVLSLVSNNVDQVIQYYSDPNGDGSTADGYDRSSHLVIKLFNEGYYQARADILTSFGISALESFEYTVNLLTTAFDFAGGDQGITIATLTDNSGAPTDPASSGNAFSYELVDPATSTAAQLAAQLNYDIFTDPTATIYTSYTAFNLPDIIIGSGGIYETEEGYVENKSDTLGFYVSRSAADHPDITRFEDDNGTYYTPAVTANVTITGMPTAGGSIRLQIHNDTAKTASAWAAATAYSLGDKVLRSTGVGTEQTAGLYMVCTTAGTSHATTEPTWDTTVNNTTADNTVTWTTYAILYYDADPASSGYSSAYTELEQFSSGDTYRVRFAELNSTTSFKTYETTGITTSTGFTVAVSTSSASVYASNAIDGSSTAVTNIFTADYANNEIDLDADLDFTFPKAFAFYCYELTTSQGMNQIWGGVNAIDAGNYLNDVGVVSIMWDETAGFVKQEDSDTSRWYRSDGARPFKDPTTGGNGISGNWKNPVYTISTGSVLTAGQQSELTQAAQAATVNTKIGTPASSVSADIAALNDFNPATDVVEGSETWVEAMRLVRAEAAGKLSVTGTTVTIRDAADTKDRITATVDDDGQRTSVTTDAS